MGTREVDNDPMRDLATTEERLRESEARHQLVFEAWAQAVWETDGAGVVKADSPSWRAYTGQTLEEWLGYGWLDAVHPDDRAYAERQWREAVAVGGIVNAEFRLRSPDGGWRWTNVRAAPLIAASGHIEKWLGLNIDIDTRKRAEAALRESEERFRGLFETMGQAYVLLEVLRTREGAATDVRILDLNRAYGRLMGVPVEEARASRVYQMFPDVDHWWLETCDRVVQTGKSERVEHQYKDGGDWFECWLYPRGEDRLEALFEKITDRKRAEDALRASEERQAFLLRLSDALRHLSEASDIQMTASRWLGDHLKVSRAMYAEISSDGPTAGAHIRGQHVREGERFPDHIPGTMFDETFVDGSMWTDDKVVMADIASDPRIREGVREAWLASGIAAAVAVALFKNERVVAIFGIHHAHPRAWSADEVALVEEVAERTWAAAERARAEAALRDSEQRFRQFADAVSDVLWIYNAGSRSLEFLSPSFENVWGISRRDIVSDPDRWADMLHPEDRERALSAMPEALAGNAVTVQYRIIRGDGEIRHIHDVGFPIFGEDGQVIRVGGIAQDLTDRTRAERALRSNERWHRALIEGIPQLVWQAVDGGEWTWASPQWSAFTGQAEPESHGRGWLEQVHPEDRRHAATLWDGAAARGAYEADYRIWSMEEKRYRWFHTRGAPVRDDAGGIIEWLGTSTDVDDLRALQARQGILLAELQHRVRNILAITRSVIARSSDGERSTEEYVQHLQGRIGAMARTQVLLTRTAGTAIDLETILYDELQSQAALDDQFTLTGESVRLSPKATEVLTLAIHELVTNATKYGAFARKSGHLEVRWQLESHEGKDWLAIDWKERGVPIIDIGPRRRGFGSDLISRRIPYELKGQGSLEFKPGGVECHISFPLVDGESILQTDTGGR